MTRLLSGPQRLPIYPPIRRAEHASRGSTRPIPHDEIEISASRLRERQMPTRRATSSPATRRTVAGSPTTTSSSVARDIPDVEPLTRPVTRAVLVEAEHDGSSLEALAAEHVAIEDVVVPVGAPIALLVMEVRPFHLHGVAVTGDQQCDVARLPSCVAQRIDGVIRCFESVLLGRRDGAHARPVASVGVHPARRQRPEGLVDLLGVMEGRGRTALRGPPSTYSSGQLQPLVLPQPSQT